MIAQQLDQRIDDKAANLPQYHASTSSKKFTAIELFSGAGGMALGFEQNGFDHLILNDQDKWCCETLRTNRPHWPVQQADVTTLDFSPYCNQVDVLAGGFPCQPFSVAGK